MDSKIHQAMRKRVNHLLKLADKRNIKLYIDERDVYFSCPPPCSWISAKFKSSHTTLNEHVLYLGESLERHVREKHLFIKSKTRQIDFLWGLLAGMSLTIGFVVLIWLSK